MWHHVHTHTKKLYNFLEIKDFDRFVAKEQDSMWVFLHFSVYVYHWLCVCQLWVCTLSYWKTNISTARYNVYLSLSIYIFSHLLLIVRFPPLFSKSSRLDIRIRIFYHIQYHFLSLSVCVSCRSQSMYSNWMSDDIQIPIVWLEGQNEGKKTYDQKLFSLSFCARVIFVLTSLHQYTQTLTKILIRHKILYVLRK